MIISSNISEVLLLSMNQYYNYIKQSHTETAWQFDNNTCNPHAVSKHPSSSNFLLNFSFWGE